MKAPPEAPSYRRVAALRELARRTLVQRRADELLIDQHAKQATFVADPSPRIAAHCGRRAGKSHAIAKRLARTALVNPDGVSVFVAISAARAIEILGRGMTLFSRRHLLNAQQVQMHGQTYWKFPNGHRVWCAGCKNRADAEKFRGDPYCAAVVDEADSMRHHLEYLVEDCLDPALLDRRGWLALTGTPGATPQGYFYEITTGDEFTMSRKQVLDFKVGYFLNALLQGLAVAPGQVRSPHALVEDHIPGKQGFPFGPVKTERSG